MKKIIVLGIIFGLVSSSCGHKIMEPEQQETATTGEYHIEFQDENGNDVDVAVLLDDGVKVSDSGDGVYTCLVGDNEISFHMISEE